MRQLLARYASAVLIAAMLCTLACSTTTPAGASDAQVRRLTPALVLTFDAPAATPDAPYRVRRFTFVSKPPHESPYGTGFAVLDRAGEVLWIYLHNGDYAPHEVRWADFDGDGREDLFFHAGFEDVATTHLYVNRIASSRYAVSHFAQAYANDDVDAVVVDFDADGRPEILAPDTYPSEDDPCGAAFHAAAVSSSEWNGEYRQLAGRYDSFNFHFGATAGESDLLDLFSQPTIVSFGPPPSVGSVVAHLKLRRRLVSESAASLSPPCRACAEEIAEYLSQRIREYDARSE